MTFNYEEFMGPRLMEWYRTKEKHIQTQLRQLRTHRLNVEIIEEPVKFEHAGSGSFRISQKVLLLPLLPRGPRPLP